MSAAARQRGWCPGALRPMLTGDGLLVRVRITGGVVSPALARALAQAAVEHGNGLIDLSARANLQLRGVREESLPQLQAGLGTLGLLDGDEAAEQVRNVMASPLAGIDPTAADVSALVRDLEAALVAARDLHSLPAKFFFAVDGGGVLPLDVEADVGITAVAAGLFRIAAAGHGVAEVEATGVIPAALDLARTFLASRSADERRMSQFMQRLASRITTQQLASPPRASTREAPLAGWVPLPEDAGAFAAAIPFGRLNTGQLIGLADLAQAHGAALRLTPWRAILLAPLKADDAADIARRVEVLGLVADAANPLLRIAACPGSPACLSGEADVQADARRLAAALGPSLPTGASLHLSGCPKGCARREPATISLTADSGRYALAFHARADDPRQAGPMALDEVRDFLASGGIPAYAAPADAERATNA